MKHLIKRGNLFVTQRNTGIRFEDSVAEMIFGAKGYTDEFGG